MSWRFQAKFFPPKKNTYIFETLQLFFTHFLAKGNRVVLKGKGKKMQRRVGRNTASSFQPNTKAKTRMFLFYSRWRRVVVCHYLVKIKELFKYKVVSFLTKERKIDMVIYRKRDEKSMSVFYNKLLNLYSLFR